MSAGDLVALLSSSTYGTPFTGPRAATTAQARKRRRPFGSDVKREVGFLVHEHLPQGAPAGRAHGLAAIDDMRIRDHMAVRGPDGLGEWYSKDERVALGHRRLAIVGAPTVSN